MQRALFLTADHTPDSPHTPFTLAHFTQSTIAIIRHSSLDELCLPDFII